MGYGSYGGWLPFGPMRRVTRCQDNILFELDGKPALNVYKKYLGEYAKDLPASGLLFPFEMLDKNHSSIGLIRTILGIDELHGGLILAGDIVADGYLRLMHASNDDLISGATTAAHHVMKMMKNNQHGLAILVSCIGRKLIMGDNIDEEVEAVAKIFPVGTIISGFYSYGEISPCNNTMECKLYNQTMTITFLTEEN